MVPLASVKWKKPRAVGERGSLNANIDGRRVSDSLIVGKH
jgi:hypothetical protein